MKHRHKPLWLFVVGLVPALSSPNAAAFGPLGHELAGRLAEPSICARARAEIEELTGGESLATIGSWADAARSQPEWAHTAPWHYINLPNGLGEAAVRAREHEPEGNVLFAIERFARELGDASLPASRRADALRFFVHFVVDVHQPLHVGRASDRGGNDFASADLSLEYREQALALVETRIALASRRLASTLNALLCEAPSAAQRFDGVSDLIGMREQKVVLGAHDLAVAMAW